MSERPGSRRPRTLRGRLTLWLCIASAASLLVFAVITTIVVTVAELREDPSETTRGEMYEALGEVFVAMAIAAPVGLGLSIACAVLLTRRALLPVETVVHSAAAMSGFDLSRRLPLPDEPEELRALVRTLNELFDRIEQAYDVMARFAADASHELRTPLAVIASEIEVDLRRARSSGEWESAATMVLEEVRRLSALVDALLRLARAEGASPASYRQIVLQSLLEQAALSCSAAAASHRASVVIAPEDAAGPACVMADPDALVSAFSNVLANAIQHSPPGGSVRIGICRSPGGRTIVNVDDMGPGVREEDLSIIFRPFQRGSCGNGHEGVGLGLSIASRIVVRHGGSIHAARAPGGGARFTIELPEAGVSLRAGGPRAGFTQA